MSDAKQDSLCREVEEAMAELLDGSASEALFEHVAGCDGCRDARHDAERARDAAKDAAADYVHPEDFEARVVAALDAHASGCGVSPRDRAPAGQPVAPTEVDEPTPAPDDGAPNSAARPAGKTLEMSATDAGAAIDGTRKAPAEMPAGKIADRPDTRPIIQPTTQTTASGLVRRLRRPRNTIIAGLIGAAAAAAAVGLLYRPDGPEEQPPVAVTPWTGKVLKVSRAAGGEGGLSLCNSIGEACQPAPADAEIAAGAFLRTDDRTRAEVELADGTHITLDRSTELELSSTASRTAKLRTGALVADVAKVEGVPARVDLPKGRVDVVGTKFALRTAGESSSVDVSRGALVLVDEMERAVKVRAGEEGRVHPGIAPYATSALGLDKAIAWSEDDESAHVVRGLGELKAKKPGSDQEKQGAVKLTSHSVKARVAAGFARTEVEEVFTNTTDEVLEGIYRFPMPPDAQIERLALEVDGKIEEAAFVDRDRAAAIFRGAIKHSAGPQAPKPREEIIWVAGPWHDPALLEWQRGGRFELRIFPIPRKGSRRVLLTYTQSLKPTGGVRRYVYPLAHDASGELRVDQFSVDVQVRGHDAGFGLSTQGYSMTRGSHGAADTLSMQAASFVPTGDLVIEYATPDRDAEMSAWAYQPTPGAVQSGSGSEPPNESSLPTNGPNRSGKAAPNASPVETVDALAAVEDSRPYLALALRPQLPRGSDDAQRAYVIVVDTSRSMYGERYERASALSARIVRELDPLDRVTVLACDTACRALPGGLAEPGNSASAAVDDFLHDITPDGASDPTLAVREAGAFASQSEGRALRVIYIGDGAPTVGAIRPGYVSTAVHDALPADGTLTSVAIGADSDLDSLRAMAKGGGGVVLPYVPGEKLGEATYAVLGATYGQTLRDARVELPAGLTEVAPYELGTLAAGGETLVMARMSQPAVEGTVVLRGRVGDKEYEQRFPLAVTATSDAGNAFVPRLFAAARIADLEQDGSSSARTKAVALSGAFNVASRYTSLLALESQQMFNAFGLDNTRRVALWTGEEQLRGVESRGNLEQSEDEEGGADDGDGTADKSARRHARKKGATAGTTTAFEGEGESMADDASSTGGPMDEPAEPDAPRTRSPGKLSPPASESQPTEPAPQPRPVSPKPQPPSQPTPSHKGVFKDEGAKEKKGGTGRNSAAPGDPLAAIPRDRWNRPMIPMRRVFERKANISGSPQVPAIASPEKISLAEAELAKDQNRREALKQLFVLQMLAGNVERAGELAARWAEKEALDPEALTARADVMARKGERDEAIRLLGSVVDVRPDDIPAQQRLARLQAWSGHEALGCRHSIAIAQLREEDAGLLAEAVGCGRKTGETKLVEQMLLSADPKVQTRVKTLLDAKPAPGGLRGDLRVTASWSSLSGAQDLDISLIHPDGHRVSWLGAPTKELITAEDCTSTSREGLAMLGAKAGDYSIEIVRASGEGRVTGELTVVAAGASRKIPFTLDGDRLVVGGVRLFWESHLVPINDFGQF